MASTNPSPTSPPPESEMKTPGDVGVEVLNVTDDEYLGSADTLWDHTSNDKLLWATIVVAASVLFGNFCLSQALAGFQLHASLGASAVWFAVLVLGLCSLKWPWQPTFGPETRVIFGQIYFFGLLAMFFVGFVFAISFSFHVEHLATSMCSASENKGAFAKMVHANDRYCMPTIHSDMIPIDRAHAPRVATGGLYAGLIFAAVAGLVGTSVVMLSLIYLAHQVLQDFEAAHPKSKTSLSGCVAAMGRLIPNTEEHIWCCLPHFRRPDRAAEPDEEVSAGQFHSVAGSGGQENDAFIGFLFTTFCGLLVWYGVWYLALPDCTVKDMAWWCFVIVIIVLIIIVFIAMSSCDDCDSDSKSSSSSSDDDNYVPTYSGQYSSYGSNGWLTDGYCVGYCGYTYSPYWRSNHQYYYYDYFLLDAEYNSVVTDRSPPKSSTGKARRDNSIGYDAVQETYCETSAYRPSDYCQYPCLTNDLGRAEAEPVQDEQCARACAAKAECKSFQYDTASMMCTLWLHNACREIASAGFKAGIAGSTMVLYVQDTGLQSAEVAEQVAVDVCAGTWQIFVGIILILPMILPCCLLVMVVSSRR